MPKPQRLVKHHRASAKLHDVSRRIDEVVNASEVPQSFSETEVREANEAAESWREWAAEHEDLTGIEFVTLDPESSTDLDQALHISETADGFRVHYAIADVPLFVTPDSALDAAARERVCTVYLPDRRIPLHPEVISEGAGSLLPGKDTPAFVWGFDLDSDARVRAVSLTRAIVRSRGKLAYDAVQANLDAGAGHEQMRLLARVGERRIALERERHGASLNTPEQEAVESQGTVSLRWRSTAEIEDANAQISLMTGMAAAQIMLDGGVGILRTMPPASNDAVELFRAQVHALKEEWPSEMPYGEFLRTLDWTNGRHLAILSHATALFRGAGYAAFDNGEVPEVTVQAALGAPYAHTTAPLRRLVDRAVLHVCWSLSSDREIDPRIRALLPELPSIMQRGTARASQVERSAREALEELTLENFVGREIEGTVLEVRSAKAGDEAKDGKNSVHTRSEVQFKEPPIARWIDGLQASVGEKVHVHVDRSAGGKGGLTLNPVRSEGTRQ